MFRRARLIAFGIVLVAVAAWAQSRLYYFNGLPYVFPSVQGAAGDVLTNDGAGTLSWAGVPTSEGLWSGSVVLSTTSCPSGWTRLSAADNRTLRGASSAGATGGSDTHSHSTSGTSGSQAVTISGATGESDVTITGSTQSTSISHTHSLTIGTLNVESGGTQVIQTASVASADPAHSHAAAGLSGESHSHSSGTLSGGGHTHSSGSLAAATASNLPAYFTVVICQKN
jgi:hypothetical protein